MAQVLFFNFFSKKDPYLNAVEYGGIVVSKWGKTNFKVWYLFQSGGKSYFQAGKLSQRAA